MFIEENLLPISALQHLVFCERQWALIHLEGIWEENRLTMEGRFLHERVDSSETEVRGDLRIARGLRLCSLRLGLIGRADVVEFHRLPPDSGDLSTEEEISSGAKLDGIEGFWKLLPVEYKRGKQKEDRSDEVQLCAQALCLEEMLNVEILSGALFYGRPQRRYEVLLDESLRQQTEGLAGRLHELSRLGETPSARYEKKCRNCSLLSFCLPKVTGDRQTAGKYLSTLFQELQEDPQ